MSLQRNKIELFSYFVISSALLFLFLMHLMWGFVAGVSSYLVVSNLKKYFNKRFTKKIANKLTLSVIALIASVLLFLLVLVSYKIYYFSVLNLTEFYNEILRVLNQIKTHIPDDYSSYIPDDVYQLKDLIAIKMHANMPNVLNSSQVFVKGFAHIIIGIIIGSIMGVSITETTSDTKPLVLYIKERFSNFSDTFSNVIAAQAKISLINTILTSLFLFVTPHLFDVHFPYAKTLICITFVLGMIPAVGNLISNSLIFLFAITVSLNMAICTILYLIFIHKLEYYFNAKLIGMKLNTKIWELLIVMVLFETVFGITGLALAPIVYGYIKIELEKKNLI